MTKQWMSKNNTDVMRAVAAIGIAYTHLPWTISDEENLFMIFGGLGDIWVGLFFLLSGYTLAYLFFARWKGDPCGHIREFVLNRLIRIYLPYVCANALYYIYLILDDRASIEAFNIVKCIFGIHVACGILWYVTDVILLYFLFAIIMGVYDLILGRREGHKAVSIRTAGMILFLVMLGFYVVLQPSVIEYTDCFTNLNSHFPICFFIGVLICFYGDIIGERLYKYKHLTLFILALLTMICFKYEQYYWLAPVTSMFACALMLGEEVESSFFSWIASISYEMYLLHPFFMYMLRFNVIFIHNDYIYVIVYSACVVLAAWVLSFLIQKLWQRQTNRPRLSRTDEA